MNPLQLTKRIGDLALFVLVAIVVATIFGVEVTVVAQLFTRSWSWLVFGLVTGIGFLFAVLLLCIVQASGDSRDY